MSYLFGAAIGILVVGFFWLGYWLGKHEGYSQRLIEEMHEALDRLMAAAE